MELYGIAYSRTYDQVCYATSAISYTKAVGLCGEYDRAALILLVGDGTRLILDFKRLTEEQQPALSENDAAVPVSSWPMMLEYLRRILQWVWYVRTEDAEPVDGKRYYVRAGTSGYVPWQGEMFEPMQAYYEQVQPPEDQAVVIDDTVLAPYRTDAVIPPDTIVEVVGGRKTITIPTPFRSTVAGQLAVVSLENTLGGTVELCNMEEPYERDRTGNGPDYKDLVISDVPSVDLASCIPIVDGAAFAPVVETNVVTGKKEMYVPGGGHMARYSNWNQKRTRTALRLKSPSPDGPVNDPYLGLELPVTGSYCYNQGILLVDLSSLGPVSVIRHTDLAGWRIDRPSRRDVAYPVPTHAQRRETPSTSWVRGTVHRATGTDVVVTLSLPQGTPQGLPVVGLFGKLFFGPEAVSATVVGDVPTVTVTLERNLVERLVLSNFQQYGRHVDDTTLVETLTDKVLDHLFDDGPIGYGTEEDMERLAYEDVQKPFVVMVAEGRRAVVSRVRPVMDIKPDKLLFPPKSGGLLVNTRTLEVVDYVRTFYDSGTLVEYSLQCPLGTVRDEDLHRTASPQIGMERYGCPGEDKYRPVSELVSENRGTAGFELVDIIVI